MKSRPIEGTKEKEYIGFAAHLWIGFNTVIVVADSRKALRETYDEIFPHFKGGLELSKCEHVRVRKEKPRKAVKRGD